MTLAVQSDSKALALAGPQYWCLQGRAASREIDVLTRGRLLNAIQFAVDIVIDDSRLLLELKMLAHTCVASISQSLTFCASVR